MRYRNFVLFTVALLILILTTGCNMFKQKPKDMPYPVDINGTKIESAPKMVAVLSPSLAEIISDMGYGASLVGRSEECDYPASVASLPAAGSILLPDIDAVAGLKPDLLLMQNQPSESIKALLKQKNIKLAVIPAASDFSGLLNLYQTIGKIFSGSKDGIIKGQENITALNNNLDQLSQTVSASANQSPITALYVTDTLGHVATGDTILSKLMKNAGAVNAAESAKNWTTENIDYTKVNFIFCPLPLVDKIKANASYKDCPAVQNNQVIGIDAAAMERQSSRMTDAAKEMAKAMYPASFENQTTIPQAETTGSTSTAQSNPQ